MSASSEFEREIEEIDRQVVALFEQRFTLAREATAKGVLAGGIARVHYDLTDELTRRIEAEVTAIEGGADDGGSPVEEGLLKQALAIDHVAIAVRSLAESIEYFRDSYGFEVVEEREVEGELSGMNTAVLVAGDVKFVLVEGTSPASNVSQYIEHYGPGVQHVAIRVREAEAVLADLKARSCDLLTGIIHADGLDQIFTRRDANTGMQIELISRSRNEGFSDNNVRELFEAMERERVF